MTKRGLVVMRLCDVRDGLTDASLLGIKRQSVLDRELCRYVMMARHSASMEGRPKADPHTWRSSIAEATCTGMAE